MMNRVLTAVLIATLAGLPARLRADEVDDAVAAHVAAWKRVRSFAFTFDTSFEVIDSGTVRQSNECKGQRWASDNERGRERYHFVDRLRSPEIEDVLVTGTELFRIARTHQPWNPDRSLRERQSLSGERKLDRTDPYRGLLPCLLRDFDFFDGSGRLTPDEIAANWKRVDAAAERSTHETVRTWRFRRGEAGPWRDNECALTFDSAVGGLCRTMRDEFTAPSKEGNGMAALVRVISVREFQKFEGIWFPVDIESVTTCGPDSHITCRWRLSDVRVNTLLESDTELRIPEQTAVKTFRADGSQGEVILYGKGQQPVRTFATPGEYDRFRLAESRHAEEQEKTRKSPRRTTSDPASPAR